MQLPETDTGSFSLYWVVEEYIVSSPVLSLTGTALSRNPGILGSLSLGAIPPDMSGLLAMVAHHLPSLTSKYDPSLARMAMALEPT